MSRKVISIGLDTKDINRAIRELNLYKQEIMKKVEIYKEKIADAIAEEAQANFSNAMIDDTVPGGTRKADVNVSVSEHGDILVIVADGEDAVWCEFGAGVYHNSPVGSSPHPKGAELGFTIGSYGKGYGKATAWGYYDESDKLVITRGTPASMPMYNAAQTVAAKAIQIAKEVWG